MQIDWVTVAAQIVNFLVLVWLLQRFLYKPVTRAMQERERKIRERLEQAEQSRAAAEAERQGLEGDRQDLAKARDDALREAREKADALRRKLEHEARDEHDEARAAARAQIAREMEEFLDTLRHAAAEEFDALARAALADLAGAELEDRAAAAFVAKLEALDDADRTAFAAVVKDAGRVTVESAFALTSDAQERIIRAVHETIAPDVDAAFDVDERLTFGVRLRAGGRVAEWTLDSYLDRFESELRDALAREVPAARDKAAE
jgi:F-type H+-transporting ATPase subunit b